MFFSFYLFPRKLKDISQSIEIKIKTMVSMCAIPVFSTDATHTCPSQKSVRVEIIDFLAWACHVFIHDEDANKIDLEYAFKI